MCGVYFSQSYLTLLGTVSVSYISGGKHGEPGSLSACLSLFKPLGLCLLRLGDHQPEKQERVLLSQSLQLVDQANLLIFVVLARKADVQSDLTPMAMSSEVPPRHIRLLSVTGHPTAVWWLGSKRKQPNQQRHFLTTPKSHSIPLPHVSFRRPAWIQMGTNEEGMEKYLQKIT